MKKFAGVLCALFLFLSLGFGQTVSHFTFTASATGFSGAGTASAGTVFGASVAMTQRTSIAYEQVVIPDLSANYYFGNFQYTIPFAALVGKKLNSKFVFDTSKWSTTFFGGAGALRQDITGTMVQHVATDLGAALNYTADNHLSVQVISGQWIHAGVEGPLRDRFVITPNVATIRTGLSINF